MDEASSESRGKARKIAIKVAEQPAPEPPVEPVQEVPRTPSRKSVRNAYIFIAIGVALVALSSFDIYEQGARGQAAMGLLIVGGLWLAYGIFSYFRAKG